MAFPLGYQYTSAPPTLWTPGALALALGDSPGIGPEQKARFAECLEWAQEAALTYHPIDDGGWNHFPNEHDPSAPDTYTTLLALNALLAAKEARLGWAGSIEGRDKLLASTRQYLIDQFESNPRGSGWNSDVLTKGVPLDGLTLRAFAFLLRAQMDGCGALPNDMQRAIRRRLVDLAHRSFDCPIARSRFNRRFAGDHGQMFDEPVLINFLWYPWAVAACREWLALAPAGREAPEDVTGVTRSLAHLVVDLRGPMLADYSGGEIYRASETVYAFSTCIAAKAK